MPFEARTKDTKSFSLVLTTCGPIACICTRPTPNLDDYPLLYLYPSTALKHYTFKRAASAQGLPNNRTDQEYS